MGHIAANQHDKHVHADNPENNRADVRGRGGARDVQEPGRFRTTNVEAQDVHQYGLVKLAVRTQEDIWYLCDVQPPKSPLSPGSELEFKWKIMTPSPYVDYYYYI